MALNKATHRGNCQVCGHEQHMMKNGLAKHGYVVQWGSFRGTCPGSGKKPMQQERVITDATIANCYELANQCDQNAADLKNGVKVPKRIKTGEKYNGKTYKYEPVYIEFKDGTLDQQTKAIELAIWEEERDARSYRNHAKDLKKVVDELHGTELVLIVEMPKLPKPEAVVDVKAGKVIGAFPTKAARAYELDKLNRRYYKLVHQVMDMYLAIPTADRTEAQDQVYWTPTDLYQYRTKHGVAMIKEFPQSADIVKEIEELVVARAAIKAAP